MEIMKRLQKKAICLMSSVIVIFGFMSCEKSGSDEQIIDADNGKMIEVPDIDTWVKDDDVKDGDLDLLVDLSVKVERMRQEFVLMLSNNGEGDKLFCGVGPQTDFDPTFKLITDMLEKQDEYKAALENLDKTAILKPTGTRGWVGNIWSILTTGMSEAEKEKEKVQEILTTNNVYGNATAQQQLYDFYCSQEPDYAKKIGAKDAKEFFNKLNNGELNSYMLNISHIWRDKGILEADKVNSAVGDYAYAAFTGKPEYLNSAYRVSSKVAVAAGELYFTAIDKIAGGYGDKIMEFGDALEKKITKLKLMKKFLEGKPDWEGVNKYVVDNLKDDIQNAISEALGDGDGIGKELIEQVSQEILDWVAEQCTSEDKGDGSAEAKEKIAEEAKADDVAIINIETDFSSQGKMIIVTDEATGKIHVATPTYDGHVTITTTPGNKLVTVIKKNGERLTKRMTVVAGSNTLVIKSEQAPYIDLNPSSISHEDDAGSETAVVLTNCKYVKLRVPNKEEWWSAQMEVNGSAGSGLHLRILYKANLEEKERSGSLILEGYKEKDDEKPAITKTVRFTQDPYSTKLEPIDVSPTSLSFGAQGGEQTVTIDYKKYKNCGGFNDEGSDDWLKVVTNSDGTLTVIASPNETGIERSGTVYAYATDLDHVETLDQAAFKAIPVTQTGEVVPGNFTVTHLVITPNCHIEDPAANSVTLEDRSYWSGREYAMKLYWVDEDSEIKVTNTNGGNSLHVEGQYKHSYTYVDSRTRAHDPGTQTQEYSFSFDIHNIAGGWEKSVINNLDVKMCNNWNGDDGYKFTENTSYSASNIAFVSKGGNSNSYGFHSTVATGLLFNKYVELDSWGGGSYDSGSREVNMISNSENSMSVSITLEQIASTRGFRPQIRKIQY